MPLKSCPLFPRTGYATKKDTGHSPRVKAHGDGCDDRMAGGGHCELSPTGACAAGRSVRENDMAWTEPAASHQRCDGKASRLAPRTRASQHLGTGAARRLLEVCGAAKN